MIKICSECLAPLVAAEDERGSPLWWCTACDVKSPRETTWTKIRKWDWQDIAATSAAVFVITVGAGLLTCAAMSISNWAHECTVQAQADEKARQAQEKKERAAGDVEKTWIVFYDSYYGSERVIKDYMEGEKTYAKILGVPYTVSDLSTEMKYFKIRATRNFIVDSVSYSNAHVARYGITIKSMREATPLD